MSTVNKTLKDIDEKTRFGAQRNMAKRFHKFFGPENHSLGIGDMSDNIDKYVDLISRSKKTDAYIARTLTSVLQQSLKNGWYFESKNPKKAEKIEKRFNQLLMDSNMNPRSFIRSVLKSFIDYSNVFIHKQYSGLESKNNRKISNITLFPSKGWHVGQTKGPFVSQWIFYYQSGVSQQMYSAEDVYHLTYNKEIHEIYGTPFILSVLEDIQHLRDLEGSAMEDYYKQQQNRTLIGRLVNY